VEEKSLEGHHPHRQRFGGRGYFHRIGPGLITGAADDDPSGIGTYSQVGAAFGFTMLWSTVAALPLAIAVQEATARLGLFSGKGLAALIKEQFPKWVLYVALVLVVSANSFNIGADLGSMAAATRLIIPLPHVSLVVAFAVVMAIIEIVLPYHQYSRVLKWLCVSLLSYIVVLFIVNVSWMNVVSEIVSPNFSFNKTTIAALIALFGTTISPYLFFWQTSEEVEELNNEGERTANDGDAASHLRAMRGDVFAGMSSGVIVMFAIMVTSAATLGTAGIRTVATAEQAAMALEPLAGSAAKYLFALGIVGTGLLAIPVLAGSTSYALAETFGWREGLSLKLSQARAFYLVIVVSMCLGMVMNLVGLDPVRALYWSAILNGVAAPPLILMIWILSRRESVLGKRRSGGLSSTFVGLAALVSAALPVVYLVM
jgi:NRAMP (natural resistance-associated macrophage protein)-like metal ion transporter